MFRTLHLIFCLYVMAATDPQHRGYYPYVERRSGGTSTLAKRGVEPDGAKISFRGPTTRDKEHAPEITDECKKLGYCPRVPNYPTELVKQLVDQTPDKSIFTSDSLDEENDVQITQRLGGIGDESVLDLCAASTKIIYPQAAPDRNDTWHTIVNLEDNQLQGLKAEICIRTGSACSSVRPLSDGYITQCKQKYVYRNVRTLSENNSFVNRELKFPSCCSCVLIARDLK